MNREKEILEQLGLGYHIEEVTKDDASICMTKLEDEEEKPNKTGDCSRCCCNDCSFCKYYL